MPKLRSYWSAVSLWLTLLCLAVATAAAALPAPGGGIAVIYPDIGEPYRSVFAKIIEGVETQARSRVPAFAVGNATSSQEIASELRRQDIRVVIALGRNGLKLATGLEAGVGVIAGGVLSVPEAEARNISVFSLAPDPALLFARLRALVPSARRVHVVYDARQNAWLLRLAKEAANIQGLELVAYDAQDLKTALRIYQDIFANADSKRDALWLPQDSVTVDESAVLPLVLQEAWARNLTVFSSSVVHVKRGALFSLYPNNAGIGHSLGTAAQGYLAGQVARGVTPLRTVLLAVNVRTAQHLGVEMGGRQAVPDMVFPEQ